MDTQLPKKFNILVVGDTCTDVYQYGRTTKLSPEAPVPIFVKEYEETKEGMASNVQNNLLALGCNVQLIAGNNRSIKTRLIDSKSNQHLLRIDQDQESDPVPYIPGFYYDAIVFSDYNKGTCTYELIEDTIRRFKGPVFVDTKKTDLQRFKDAIIKINSREYLESEGGHNVSNLIVTYGKQGAMWKDKYFPAPSVEVSDVCGAGDTFLAALVYKYLDSNDLNAAISFAIKSAAITVQHMGVYSPAIEDIE
jgi:bifunctional ADP-heptose synthase (sugar kinase/adenylyltransferase)